LKIRQAAQYFIKAVRTLPEIMMMMMMMMMIIIIIIIIIITSPSVEIFLQFLKHFVQEEFTHDKV